MIKNNRHEDRKYDNQERKADFWQLHLTNETDWRIRAKGQGCTCGNNQAEKDARGLTTDGAGAEIQGASARIYAPRGFLMGKGLHILENKGIFAIQTIKNILPYQEL